MGRVYKLKGYSSFPLVKSPKSEPEARARGFGFAFKNGRNFERASFDEVVSGIVQGLAKCPAFFEQAVLVPMPRSGSSRASFGAGACEHPTRELARAICAAFPKQNHGMASLIRRKTPVRRSSDSETRVSVDEHLASMALAKAPQLKRARIVLLDDVLVKGTQAIACLVKLRLGGFEGPIEAYSVSQSVLSGAPRRHRLPWLEHELSWAEGTRLARRINGQRWRLDTGRF